MKKEQLEQHRFAALDLYKVVKKEYPKKLSEDLQTLYENIEENKFLLAIMGEVKAGKSTFINAILGEELLPSDARQATSVIVEIFKAETKFIQATFANGRIQEMEDDLSTPDIDEAVEFLKGIAAVREEYRDLPIIQLNDFIIKKFDNKANEAVFTDADLDEWIENTELQNIHQIDKKLFIKKIKSYINEKRDGNLIPKRIAVGYPHNFKFDQFRLVDTPGIGAIGGIEEETKRFIKKADAVIYLHKGAPQL